MKNLKVIIVFVLVLGLLLGVMLIMPNISSGPSPEPDPEPGYDEPISEMVDKIEFDWSHQSVWNDAFYGSYKNKIEQKVIALYGDNDEKGRLMLDGFYQVVCGHLYEWLNDEFHSSECRADIVDKNMRGVSRLCDDAEYFKNDHRISEINDIYRLYCDIRRFCSRSFRMEPQWQNRSKLIWTPFDNFAKSVLAQRDAYKDNPIYREHIKSSDLAVGLNEVEKKLAEAKEYYYNGLSSDIIAYFQDITPNSARYTAGNRELLTGSVAIFKDQYGTSETLTDFMNDFDRRVCLQTAIAYLDLLKESDVYSSKLAEIRRWLDSVECDKARKIGGHIVSDLERMVESYEL